MRIVFLGSGDFGLPTLERLVQRHDVVAVVSQPDRSAGRRRQLTPTPVAAWAQRQGLDVRKSENVNDAGFIERVRAYRPDVGVVIAFGQKLSPELIDAFGRLAINVHGSLLPRYRGAAPVNWAVIQGEKVTGITVIGLAQRMDAGAMYGQARIDIDPGETAGEVHDRLASLGPELVTDVLTRLERGTLEAQPQDDAEATRAPKLSKADGTVDFAQPAERVRARVHGLTPWPGCRVAWHRAGAAGGASPAVLTLRRVEVMAEVPAVIAERWPDAEPGRVLDRELVMTGQGLVRLIEVQAAGTRVMSADAFARGHGLAPGDLLTAMDDPAK
ncbi:MAG: methionyl-tRNA formyltransferase [Phycisphaeraceae bacterium]